MQTTEFDKLMVGKPAKWLEELDMKKWDEVFLLHNPNKELKSELKEEIKTNEKPIPFDIQNAIQKFIKEERDKGSSERKIRRAVKRKWNICVVDQIKIRN